MDLHHTSFLFSWFLLRCLSCLHIIVLHIGESNLGQWSSVLLQNSTIVLGRCGLGGFLFVGDERTGMGGGLGKGR